MTPGASPYTMIDQLRLEALIGRGGMGDIWRASHVRDRSSVAVKVLREELVGSTQAREQFRREAEIIQQLKSPQVVQVYRYSVTSERVPYMVMELLEGQDLQTYVDQEGPLPVTEALSVMVDVLKAISEAHQLGVIHRDIKPSNLFLLSSPSATSGLIKILDFGLATQHNHASPKQMNHLVGTYLFMAPEQAKRETISPRADLYSIGATLYTLLTGVPPRKPTGGDRSFDHFDQPAPKLSQQAPKIKAPAKLDQLIQRCLAIQPHERPESADVLRRALEQILHQLRRRQGTSEVDELNLSPAQSSSVLTPVDTKLDAQNTHSSILPQHETSSQHTSAHVAFEGEQAISLLSLLQSDTEVLTQRWTQAITERPERSRVQAHRLKNYIKSYLQILEGLAAGQAPALYRTALEPLAQLSFTHPPLALLPLITTSILRRVIKKRLETLESQSQKSQIVYQVLSQLDLQIFRLRQTFIQVVTTVQSEDSNNALYRLFSSGSETPLLCTLSGVAINTHPDLRAAFIRDESLGLTGRKLLDILKGFQPIAPLYEALTTIRESPPHKPYRLFNENATGRAEELIAYPHLLTQTHQQNLLLIIDVVDERQMTEFLPSLDDLGHDFASPQALPWQMTSEVQALKPEELSSDRHQRLSDLSAQTPVHHPNLPRDSDQNQTDDEERYYPEDEASKSTNPELPPVADTPNKSAVHHTPQPESPPARIETSISSSEGYNLMKVPPREMSSKPAIKKSSIWDDYHPQSYMPSATPLPVSIPISTPPQRHAPPSRSSLAQPPRSPINSAPPRSESNSITHRRRSAAPSYLFTPEIKRHPSSYPVQAEQEYHHHRLRESSHPAPPKAPDTAEYIRPRPSSSSNPRHSSGSHLTISDPSGEQLHEYIRETANGFGEVYTQNQPMRSDSSAPTHPPYERSSISHAPVQHHHVGAYTDVSISPPRPNTRQSQPDTSMVSRLRPRPGLQNRTSLPIIQHTSQELSMSTDRSSPLSQNVMNQPHHVPQQREAVDREHLRISVAQEKLTDRHSWMLNILMFVVFVLTLLLLREPVTQWIKGRKNPPQVTQLKPTPPKSQGQMAPRQPTPSHDPPASSATTQKVSTSTPQAKATPSKRVDKDSGAHFEQDYVMVKVNVNKATFFLRKNGEVICRQIPFCAIPVGSGLMIRSQGYYEVYIKPEELNAHQGEKAWMIKLEPEPETQY